MLGTVHIIMYTYVTKDSSSSLIISGDDIKIDIDVQHNGTSSYQVIQIRTGKSDQPESIGDIV